MGFDVLQPAGLVIKVSEIVLHVADEPYFVVDLLDADLLCRMYAVSTYGTESYKTQGRQVLDKGTMFCAALMRRSNSYYARR